MTQSPLSLHALNFISLGLRGGLHRAAGGWGQGGPPGRPASGTVTGRKGSPQNGVNTALLDRPGLVMSPLLWGKRVFGERK